MRICVADVGEFIRDHPELMVTDTELTGYGYMVEYQERPVEQAEFRQASLRAMTNVPRYVIEATTHSGSKIYLTKRGKATFHISEALRVGEEEASNKALWATLNSKNGMVWTPVLVRQGSRRRL